MTASSGTAGVLAPQTPESAFAFRPRLTYAIVPPNRTTPAERRSALASAQSSRILALPIDALLVYDVQDEVARNAAPRPFSFAPKVDPINYAFHELDVGALPRVVYSAVTKEGAPTLRRWLDTLQALGGHAVLVGAPSGRVPPQLSLPEALSICRSHTPSLTFGGVLIPERHEISGLEDARVWAKTQQGCRFFVSQTVWSVSATKRVLHDLRARAEGEGGRVPPILLTFSPCGSPQTLEFLRWLGVNIPTPVRRELLAAKDMLERSVELAADAFAELSAFAAEQGLHVGCNVESVSSRPAEVDASVELVHRLARHLPAP